MIQINLLPVRKKKKKGNAQSFLLIYALTVVLAASTIGYLWVSKKNEIKSSQTRVDKLKVEVKRYEQFERILSDLEKERDGIKRRKTVIADLQKDRDKMVRLLALLGAAAPPNRIWFEKIVQSGPTLTLDGIALSNETVAEFMRELEGSPYIEKTSVSLMHSRQTVMNDFKLREFRLAFRFLPFSTVAEKLKKQTPASPVVAPTAEGKVNG